MEKIKGFFVKIYCRKESWGAGKFKISKTSEKIDVVGNIFNLEENLEYDIFGEWVENKTYGKQFKVSYSNLSKSDSIEYAFKFLSSGLIRGVGPSLAKRIINAFGKDTLNIFETNPKKLLQIDGIGEKKYNEIINSYSNNTIFSQLYELTDGVITSSQAEKIIKVYGKESACKKVKENPYDLIHYIDGIGFLKADKIAKGTGIPEKSIQRVGASIEYILKQKAENGHCFGFVDDFQNDVLELLCPFNLSLKTKKATDILKNYIIDNADSSFDELDLADFTLSSDNLDYLIAYKNEVQDYMDLMAEALFYMRDKGFLVIDDDKVYLKDLYIIENELADILSQKYKPLKTFTHEYIEKSIKKTESILFSENNEKRDFDDIQKNAIKMALTNRISVITGGPGRGKTTVVRAIADAWNDDDSLILLSPTGRASKKLSNDTHRDASTIHKFLLKTKDDFVSNNLIVIDESSMLDIRLAYTLVKLLKHNQIIFVGDPDQLPSIGPGKFFLDLLSCSNIPTEKLIKVYRNGGSIVHNVDLINSGKSIKNFIFDNKFSFVENDKESLLEDTIDEYMKLLQNNTEKDIVILSPMNKGMLGCDNINEIIRNKINPISSENNQNEKFRIGDRIMCTKNNYETLIIDENGEEKYGIFNGDCGKISSYNDETGEYVLDLDDGGKAFISTPDLENFKLGYAITIHKSQGSEYKHVICLVSYSFYTMLKRNLLYTAISRAKDAVYLKGTKTSINYAIRNTEDISRNTFLLKRIQNILSNNV